MKRWAPSISVIIPSYKDGKNNFETLKKTIKSVKKQNYPNLEIIVVVDGSKDGTEEFVKNQKIKYIINKKNLGLAKSLNKGIKISKGEIVITLHSDIELVGDDWIEKIVKIFKNPKIAGGTGNPIPKFDKRPSILERVNLYFVGAYGTRKVKCIIQKGMLANKCDAYKKSVLKKIGYFNERYKVSGEDLDLALKIKKAGYKMVLVPDCKFIMNLSPIQNNLIKNCKKRFQYGRVVPRVFLDHPLSLLKNKEWFITTIPYLGYFVLIFLSIFIPPIIVLPLLFNIIISLRIAKRVGICSIPLSFLLIPVFTFFTVLGILYGILIINRKII